jgi:hypothetical protein
MRDMKTSSNWRIPIPAVGFMVFWIPMILLALRLIKSREPGVGLVILLFSIPLILQTLGLFLPQNKSLLMGYWLFSLCSSGPYLVCLTIYLVSDDPGYLAAPLCITVSLGQVVLAALITGIFSRGTSVLRKISRLGGSRGGEVLLALAIFISVAYLLAFSFAFDDRYRVARNNRPGLIRTASVADDDSLSVESPVKLGSIFFELGSARLEAEELQGQSQDRLAEINKLALQRILKRFEQFKIGQSLRVTLKGYATTVPIRAGSYISNYELAQARIAVVQNFLWNALARKYDIDWILVPNVTEDLVGARQERKVDIEVQEIRRSMGVRPLTLLEYLYFTTYTITTTGYGDIIPRSPLAMFICTVANWYEVFFCGCIFQCGYYL